MGVCALHGVIMLSRGDRLYVAREPNAVAGLTAAPGEPWDRRWRVFGPGTGHLQVRALGEAGLLQVALPADRAPRPVLAGLPSLWDGDRLVAAPHLGHGLACTAELSQVGHFVARLLSD